MKCMLSVYPCKDAILLPKMASDALVDFTEYFKPGGIEDAFFTKRLALSFS